MREQRSLEVDCYYEANTRRLFGPRESISDMPGSSIIEVSPGDLLKCVRLYSVHRVKLASFALVSENSNTQVVIETTGPDRRVPYWLSLAAPLRVLAAAAID